MIMVMATITARAMVMTMVIPMADIMTVRIVDQNQIQVIVAKNLVIKFNYPIS